ncbi:MAG: hypothetical protein U0R52_01230 [Solirubrobacterales bacterium]
MLSTSRYLLGVFEVLALAGTSVLGATSVRARLLGGWSGPPAWLAVAVLALALVLGAAELLGLFGALRPLPLLVVVAAAGVCLRVWLGTGESGAGPAAQPGSLELRLAGLAFAAVVIAHFFIGVRLRLSTGMTGFDSTWYHGPFAAGFAQSGETFRIQFIAPQFLAWFYPQNSELVHGIGILAFSRDLLSPLLNLGWLAGCLVAAWCLGRPFGAAPVSLAGAALVLGSGILADQAGEARNDMPAIFFLLTSLAVAVSAASAERDPEGAASRLSAPGAPTGKAAGGIAPGAVAICGLAAGLAAGTKVNYLAPALALVAGLAAIAPRGERLRALALAGLPALAGCGFWYLRNLVHAGNPLPWLKSLGPLGLPSPDQPIGGRAGASVAGYLFDPSIWTGWFFPGLHEALGLLWPAVLALAAAGLALPLVRRAEPVLRVAALTGVVAAAAWLVAPASASGPDGHPLGFASGLRYLAPALVIGLALLPVAPRFRSARARWTVLAGLAVVFSFVAESGEPWYSGYLATALALGLGVACLAGAVTAGWPGRRHAARTGHGHAARTGHGHAARAVAVALGLLVVAAGARAQRTYLENRYARPGFTVAGLDAAFRWARDLSGVRIATTATRQYPLWGTDLSNWVQWVGVHRPRAGFVAPKGCRAWRRALNEGAYDYVVVSRDRLAPGPAFPPQAAWTASDPAARRVLRVAPTVVFRLDGPLDPSACP